MLLIVASVSSIGAQIPAKYQPEIDLGYSIGTGTFSTNRVNIHTIQGAKFGDYFSAGIGLGVDYYHELYNIGELVVPVFLNMKGYLPVAPKFTPYLSLDMGYSIGATSGVSGMGGMLLSPSVGIRYNRAKFQLGYINQHVSKNGVGINVNAIQFLIGVVF